MKVVVVVLPTLSEHSGVHALDASLCQPVDMLAYLTVVRWRQWITGMVTVPDDLHGQNTWVLGDLDKSIQRSLNLFVLFVNILGRDLPVGFGLRQVRLVDPCATLIAKVSVHVVSSPANDDQNRESGTVLKTVLALHFLNELPDLVVDGTKAFSPFEAGVDRPNLIDRVVLALQKFTKGEPRTEHRAVMVGHKGERWVTNDNQVGLTFRWAFNSTKQSRRDVLHQVNNVTVRPLRLIGVLADETINHVTDRDLPTSNFVCTFIAIRKDACHAWTTNGGELFLPLENPLIDRQTKLRSDLLHLEICVLTPIGMFRTRPTFRKAYSSIDCFFNMRRKRDRSGSSIQHHGKDRRVGKGDQSTRERSSRLSCPVESFVHTVGKKVWITLSFFEWLSSPLHVVMWLVALILW